MCVCACLCATVCTSCTRRDYYDAALRSPHLLPQDAADLRHDLARLLIKLRRFDEASRLLEEGLAQAEGMAAGGGDRGSGGTGGGGVGDRSREVGTLLLLADVFAAEVGGLGAGTDGGGSGSRARVHVEGGGRGNGFDDDDDDEDDDEDEAKSGGGGGGGGGSAGLAESRRKLEAALHRAKDLQQALLSERLSDSDSSVSEEDLEAHRVSMSAVCCRLADFHASTPAKEAPKLDAKEALVADAYREASDKSAMRTPPICS